MKVDDTPTALYFIGLLTIGAVVTVGFIHAVAPSPSAGSFVWSAVLGAAKWLLKAALDLAA